MAGLTALLRLLPFCVVFSLAAKSTELLMGEKAYSRGAYDTAKKHFQTAIENGEESGDPHLYIGLILESRRQYAESIPYFRAAAERPMQSKFRKVAYWKLVILYRQARLYGESLRYVNKLEEMGQKSELFEKIRAEAETHPGNANYKGNANIQKAIQLEKEYRTRREAGDEESELHELIQQIIAQYNQAITEDARWKEYRLKIAQYQEKLDRKAEAETTYRQVWEESHDANAAYKLGLFARKAGNYREALRYFAAALEKVGDDARLRFYIRLNAAQSHYALANPTDAFAHAKHARKLATELTIKGKTLQSLRRIYCLSQVSQEEPDAEFCRFKASQESKTLIQLYKMKLLVLEKKKDKAAELAAQIYDQDLPDEDESENNLPSYAVADLPLAIGLLFEKEKYRAVLDLTDRFHTKLSARPEFHAWRGVSYFALKEYGSALVEFDALKNPSPSQMNLHLMTMANIGDWAGVKEKGTQYLKNPKARAKLTKNFRNMKLYAPLREDPNFEDWLSVR
ncbi:MAG: tetratricopeptide repeat protein [Spirochaetes bacterium]|nr:tetratricopeptide repeat protein [Spirochaetota bacterium]